MKGVWSAVLMLAMLVYAGDVLAQPQVRQVQAADFERRTFRDWSRVAAEGLHQPVATPAQIASGDPGLLVVENSLLAANACAFVLRGERNGVLQTAYSGRCPSRNLANGLGSATVSFANFCQDCTRREVWVVGREINLPTSATPPVGAQNPAPPVVQVVPPPQNTREEPLPTPPVSQSDAGAVAVTNADASVQATAVTVVDAAVSVAPVAIADAATPAIASTAVPAGTTQLPVAADAGQTTSPALATALRERDELRTQVADLTRQRDERNPLNFEERSELSSLRDRMREMFTSFEFFASLGVVALLCLALGIWINDRTNKKNEPLVVEDDAWHATQEEWETSNADWVKACLAEDETGGQGLSFLHAYTEAAEKKMAANHEAALLSQKNKLIEEHKEAMRALRAELAQRQVAALAQQRQEVSSELAIAAQTAFNEYDARMEKLEQEHTALANKLKEAERARDEAVAKLALLETDDTKLNGKLFPVPGTGHDPTDGRTSHVGPIDDSGPDGSPDASASSTQIRGTG
jgi:hypothetical protein